MTTLRWAAIGVTLGSVALHGTLGLRRPIDRTHLSFACIMAAVAAYLYFRWELELATTAGAVASAIRYQLLAIDGVTILVLVLLCCAVQACHRAGRRPAAIFTAALVIIVVHGIIDAVADGGTTWPHLADLAAVTWGLLMSVQLAHDFRVQAQALTTAIAQLESQVRALTSILGSLRALEHDIHGPLERLESGIAALEADARHDGRLAVLRRSAARLREVARSLPELGRASPHATAAHA